jgi:hypothetical protein
MLPLKPYEDKYKPCMHAWAILTSCMVQGEFSTRAYIPGIVKIIQENPACATHISTCPCKFPNHHFTHHDELKLLAPLGIPHNPHCRCAGFECKAVLDAQKAKEQKRTPVIAAYSTPKARPGAPKKPNAASVHDIDFAKNLFQTFQGVKYDDKCPHDLPFYACMSCSH